MAWRQQEVLSIWKHLCSVAVNRNACYDLEKVSNVVNYLRVHGPCLPIEPDDHYSDTIIAKFLFPSTLETERPLKQILSVLLRRRL